MLHKSVYTPKRIRLSFRERNYDWKVSAKLSREFKRPAFVREISFEANEFRIAINPLIVNDPTVIGILYRSMKDLSNNFLAIFPDGKERERRKEGEGG